MPRSVAVRAARAAVNVALAVAVFLVAGEIFARALGIVDRLNGYARQLVTAGPSAALPYRLRPGVELVFEGAPVRIDSLGLRGPEVAATPPAGTVRLLALGDSVVFGWRVAEDATVANVLARRLTDRWRLPVEVLNAGTYGYDTVAEAAFLAGPGLALAPSGVIVGMSLNDYDPAPSYDPTGVLTRHPSNAAPSLLARSELLLLLRWMRSWWRGELFTQMLERSAATASRAAGTQAALDALVAQEHARFYRDPDPALWARMRAALASLRDTAAAHGVWLVVAIFPEAWQVGVAAPDRMPQERLLALCHDVGVACLDLQPAFAAAGSGLFQDTQHPNARGLEVAADAIARAIAAPP